jgi:hypothetical protein
MDFKTKTINEIRTWIWAAVMLPLVALVGLSFIWYFTPSTILDYAFLITSVVIFSISVFWWWWSMYTIRNLVYHLDETKDHIKEVSIDIKKIRATVLETMAKDK